MSSRPAVMGSAAAARAPRTPPGAARPDHAEHPAALVAEALACRDEADLQARLEARRVHRRPDLGALRRRRGAL